MPVLSLACHVPHNTPHIPSRYNNEQTTKQTKAINNSYIYINISCKCDTNRAGHFTLDAYASRPVACMYMRVSDIAITVHHQSRSAAVTIIQYGDRRERWLKTIRDCVKGRPLTDPFLVSKVDRKYDYLMR